MYTHANALSSVLIIDGVVIAPGEHHFTPFRVEAHSMVSRYRKRVRETMRKEKILQTIFRMMVGHLQYYGVSENSDMLENYHYQVGRLLFKWLNRRSQKRSFTWEKFNRYLRRYPLPKVRIYHDPR